MSEQSKAAIIRSLYTAVGTFLSSFCTALLAGSPSDTSALVAAVAAFAVLGFRGGVEGAVDTYREKHGIVTKADVGATPDQIV